jgi:hypothetical protein
MTNAERLRRFRQRHRERLPWGEDRPFHPELAEWEASALEERPKAKAVVIPLRDRAPVSPEVGRPPSDGPARTAPAPVAGRGSGGPGRSGRSGRRPP